MRSPLSPPAALKQVVIPLPSTAPLEVETERPAVALSPDGTRLVYVANRGGKRQLFLRRMDRLEATPIPGTEGGNGPFFSPDGQSVGFVVGGKMKKVLVSGGTPQTLTPVPPITRGAAWGVPAEPPVTDISQSPTLTEEMTRAGVILGTAAYMSPEQAKGKPVDKRADIFAFGAVLYELLTGKRAFEGETITETIAKVLESEPKWELLPENTPWTIRTLLRRCLTKDILDRLDGIGNVRIEIKLALQEPAAQSPTGAASAVQPTRRLWAMAVGLVVLGAVVAGLGVWLFIQPSSPEQSLNRFVITPSSTAVLTNLEKREVAVSPDGRQFVYYARPNVGEQTREGRLYLRSLDHFVDRPIPGAIDVPGIRKNF